MFNFVFPQIKFISFMNLFRLLLFTDKHFWNAKATDELNTALKIKWNEGIAKNVIIFVGDGMGITTITSSRIYKGGESHKFTFEQFPHIGLLKVRFQFKCDFCRFYKSSFWSTMQPVFLITKVKSSK